jgi:hypothetical protein
MSDTKILRQLFSAYANAQVTVETIAVYDRLLADIPPADLQTVVDQAIAECKFLPTVAELRERYHALTRTLGRLTATDAWGQVKAEIRRIGSWGVPTFDDPVIAKVVRNMGWNELCMSESPEGVDRAQFERAYNEIVNRGEAMQKLLPQARDMAERHIGSLQHISGYLPKPREN